ncbi:hypothetical protein P43SY_003032 [Pythium insidiosum]|uniref:Fatty acyl-CoA reductase n=1 Tax=Pythium insidiosum TaxID=114742 RepID=A0AAD5Q882_PYTIN|nr:hypothetical protein P43SY_003032 [Pythium insidiosum]
MPLRQPVRFGGVFKQHEERRVALERRIDALQIEVQSATEQLESVSRERDFLRRENMDQKRALEAAMKEVERRSDEARATKADVSSLMKLLEDANVRNAKAEKTSSMLMAVLARTQEQSPPHSTIPIELLTMAASPHDVALGLPALETPSAFAHKHIFITGATGFLGKAIVEKLLRSCPDVDKIYVLIRSKKELSAAARLEKEIMDSPIFDRIRHDRGPKACDSLLRSKLVAVDGDVTLPALGLDNDNQEYLRRTVQVTIHSAAMVQFNQPIDAIMEMNCKGAINVVDFVNSCRRIECHLHVSTAYVNSHLREPIVKEELYPLPFDVEEAIVAVDEAARTSPQALAKVEKKLMAGFPNTYTLTKAMAEHLIVKRMGNSLPLVIYRPTIIGAAYKEPMPGWVDQVAGAGAIYLAIGMGVLTIIPGDTRNVADIVPVDLAVNTVLLAVQATIAQRDIASPTPFVLHCGTSDPRRHPVLWRVSSREVHRYFRERPTARKIFNPSFRLVRRTPQFKVEWFFRYTLPTRLYATAARISRNEARIDKAQKLKKLTKKAKLLADLFQPFTKNEWIFQANSTEILQPFTTSEWWLDVQDMEWVQYTRNYCAGLKKYVLKEDVPDVEIQWKTPQHCQT